MRPSHRDTILVRMHFCDGNVARSALAELGRDRELSVTVFQGRNGPKAASIELEVSGPAVKIKEFVRRSDTEGSSFGTSSIGIA